MPHSDTIEIPISKVKLILMVLAGLGFVTASVCFVVSPEFWTSPIQRSPRIIFAVGCVGIAFFGFVSSAIVKKIFDNTPGLIISEDGVTDNSSGISAGFIPWSDIVAVKEQIVVNQRFVNLVVKNHKKYVRKQKGWLKKKIMQKNYDIFGTGIGISANGLKIDFDTLKKLLQERFAEFKAKAAESGVRHN